MSNMAYGGKFDQINKQALKQIDREGYKKEVLDSGFGIEDYQKGIRDYLSSAQKNANLKGDKITPLKMSSTPLVAQEENPLMASLQQKQQLYAGDPTVKEKILGIA